MDQNQSRKLSSDARSSDAWGREVDWSAKDDWQGVEYFLTPQQRLKEIGEILAIIAMRSLKQEQSLSLQTLHELDSQMQKEDWRKPENENETN